MKVISHKREKCVFLCQTFDAIQAANPAAWRAARTIVRIESHKQPGAARVVPGFMPRAARTIV